MQDYQEEIDLYFDLKGSPDSTREGYSRRIKSFIKFMQNRNTRLEEITLNDIQQYIIYLKKDKNLSPGSINRLFAISSG